MLSDLTYWLSSLHPNELLALIFALLLVDTPRYVLSKLAVCFYDGLRDLWRTLAGRRPRPFEFCPSVCAVLVAHNEQATIGPTLRSIIGTYPDLEVIIVDDGSTDATAGVAEAFIEANAGHRLRLLRKDFRGGKASCYNFALRFTQAQVVLVMDCDTEAGEHAIWEIVQPFVDERVGAVSAAVLARNPFDNLLTCLQAFEYLHSIFVGRLVNARLGILGIVSGAFGAFRREALERVGGCDIGPGDDSDMTMRVRKAGYRIGYAPYAQCFTNVPTSLAKLFRQRRRWNRGAIRYKCRKHVDMAALWNPGFIAANFFMLANVWVFNILTLYLFWAYAVWMCFHWHEEMWWILLVAYLSYIVFHVFQAAAILFYSNRRWRDALICCVIPLAPAYQLFRKVVRLVSITEEIFLRASYNDPFYPEHVRAATWRW